MASLIATPATTPTDVNQLPVRVSMAMDVMRWAQELMRIGLSLDSHHNESRASLTALEQRLYDTAMEIMRLYLSGEMEFVVARDSETVP